MQILKTRNGSTELQGFVYHFVGNFTLLHENVISVLKIFTVSEFTTVRRDGDASSILDIGT